jgi:arginase
VTEAIELITAPSSLGLRPEPPGHEPGAWRAPDVLLAAGLAGRLQAARVVELNHPRYAFQAQPGTRIRNGHTLRAYSLALADAVTTALDAGRFPVVVGGDCSVLLGCLLAARHGGRCGLLHVDGHRDFLHPNNYDTTARLGSAAGMDRDDRFPPAMPRGPREH